MPILSLERVGAGRVAIDRSYALDLPPPNTPCPEELRKRTDLCELEVGAVEYMARGEHSDPDEDQKHAFERRLIAMRQVDILQSYMQVGRVLSDEPHHTVTALFQQDALGFDSFPNQLMTRSITASTIRAAHFRRYPEHLALGVSPTQFFIDPSITFPVRRLNRRGRLLWRIDMRLLFTPDIETDDSN